MEGTKYVLIDAARTPLFVRLTFGRKGKRPQWEHTEFLDKATQFESLREAEQISAPHKIPRSCGEAIEYEIAYELAMKAYGSIVEVKLKA